LRRCSLLGAGVGTWLDADASDRSVRSSVEQFARFADRLGDDLSRERRALCECLLDSAPRLLACYHSHRHAAVTHGDAHVWNCLLPRDGGKDVCVFDWDSWRIDVATDDLAYMMALHWYPDRRQRLERPPLDRYHAALVAHGVQAYDRRMLDDDYRLSVLWHMLTPMWQAASNIPPASGGTTSRAFCWRSMILAVATCWSERARRLPQPEAEAIDQRLEARVVVQRVEHRIDDEVQHRRFAALEGPAQAIQRRGAVTGQRMGLRQVIGQ